MADKVCERADMGWEGVAGVIWEGAGTDTCWESTDVDWEGAGAGADEDRKSVV